MGAGWISSSSPYVALFFSLKAFSGLQRLIIGGIAALLRSILLLIAVECDKPIKSKGGHKQRITIYHSYLPK